MNRRHLFAMLLGATAAPTALLSKPCSAGGFTILHRDGTVTINVHKITPQTLQTMLSKFRYLR